MTGGYPIFQFFVQTSGAKLIFAKPAEFWAFVTLILRDEMIKTNTERQAKYRQKQTKGSLWRPVRKRIDLFINEKAKQALDSMAKEMKLKQREILEALLLSKSAGSIVAEAKRGLKPWKQTEK